MLSGDQSVSATSLLQQRLTINTTGRGLYDITSQVQEIVKQSGRSAGLCNIFLHHTSASLIICENDDPQVLKDLENFMQRLAPDGDNLFKHVAEGPDDMPAHVRTILTQSSLVVPIANGTLSLGTWQGIYLWEHRLKHYSRSITVTVF